MKIVLSTDSKYVEYCAVTLMSIVSNNDSCDFYILTDNLEDEDINLLQRVVNYNKSTLHIIHVPESLFANFPMPDNVATQHISLATYYRLFLPILMPTEVERLLYLDCDIIVRSNLTELWNTNIENNALAAVCQMDDRDEYDIKRLGYETSYGYFNAGVLLINLDYWRKHDSYNCFLKFIEKNRNIIEYHDQDVLNAVFYDSKLMLSCKWNMMTSFFKKYILKEKSSVFEYHNIYREIIKKEVSDPAIVHFVSRPKAWEPSCKHPFKKDYLFYHKKVYVDSKPSIYVLLLMFAVELLRKLKLSPYL